MHNEENALDDLRLVSDWWFDDVHYYAVEIEMKTSSVTVVVNILITLDCKYDVGYIILLN